jgi:hypothetical protein
MRRTLALGLTLLSAAACGPLQSAAYLSDAETQRKAALSANAPERAPYEWTSGSLYLRKAREEAGYSQYEEAVTYATKATEQFTQATRRAVGTPARSSAPPRDETPKR